MCNERNKWKGAASALPVTYFGGKRKVSALVWQRFGAVANYVEPFFGSGAMLLGRPEPFSTETVNDADGLLANFWRALVADPDAVAHHADWPVNENDLHARHAWLVGQKDSLQARLEGDPDFHDAKIAGWWAWGMACWIGSGFCSGKGPWQVLDIDGVKQLVDTGNAGQGVNRQRVHLGNAGQGVNRQLVHLGDAGQGVNRKRVHLGDAGRGVNRKLVHLSDAGQGVNRKREELQDFFHQLAERLREVRVCCGDWTRVCGPSVTHKHGLTAVFLDPPYADTAGRDATLYRVDCTQVAHAVREWAIEQGKNPLMRICLAGYDGEHQMPEDWDKVAWNAGEGLGSQAEERTNNGKRERLWFSPACEGLQQKELLLPCKT